MDPKSKRMEATDIMTTTEAADFLRVTKASLERLRFRGSGPVYSKIEGVGVRYLRTDLEDYVQRSRVRRLPLPAPGRTTA
jgi:hypothetical protein